MKKLYEVRTWQYIEAEDEDEVREVLDEVLGFAVRQRTDIDSYGIEEIVEAGEEAV